MNDQIFFGRQQYLDLITKRMRDLRAGYRQNMAILGDELVGKTSIILKILRQWHDPCVIAVYVETRPESLQAFSQRFIGTLLYSFLSNSGRPLQENLNFLIEKSTPYIPKTVEKIRSILISTQKRRSAALFADLLSLGENLYQESGKHCVIIFDEFTNLERMGIKNIYCEWSKLLMVHKNTLYIILSSRIAKTRSILAKELSLLFGNFEVVTVEPFDTKSCEQYLASRFKGYDIGSREIRFLVNFCAGYPFYLNVITAAVCQSSPKPLADVLEYLLFDTEGILYQRFSLWLKRFTELSNSEEDLGVLRLISAGHTKIKDIAHILKLTRAQLASKAARLLELDILTRTGDFLTINDRVFSFWFMAVYQEKLVSLTPAAQHQKQQFIEHIQAMIQEFHVQAGKPLLERMMDLLRLFQDDLAQVERKKVRLTQFREIKPVEMTAPRLRQGLLGRSHDALWVMALAQDTLTEEDITAFAKECKKYRNKLELRIIISTQEIEMNVHLRALEEKVITWNLEQVNQICDLFSRPRVIV